MKGAYKKFYEEQKTKNARNKNKYQIICSKCGNFWNRKTASKLVKIAMRNGVLNCPYCGIQTFSCKTL
jgi:transcription elongation factor Elf1